MTRKCCLLFAILCICLFCLLSGTLGEEGFFYKKQLENLLKNQNEVLKQLEQVYSNLEIRKENIFSEETLKNNSFDLGYVFESNEVYFFEPDNLEYETEKMYDLKKIQVEKQEIWFLSHGMILLISISISAVITLFVFLLKKARRKSGDKDGTE